MANARDHGRGTGGNGACKLQEIARKLGYELVGHKLELYGHVIPGTEPVEREGLIYKRRPRDEVED